MRNSNHLLDGETAEVQRLGCTSKVISGGNNLSWVSTFEKKELRTGYKPDMRILSDGGQQQDFMETNVTGVLLRGQREALGQEPGRNPGRE